MGDEVIGDQTLDIESWDTTKVEVPLGLKPIAKFILNLLGKGRGFPTIHGRPSMQLILIGSFKACFAPLITLNS